MSAYKISGHCTHCNGRCFDIMAVNEPHEDHPGEPKRVGAAEDHAVRITFKLFDGVMMDLTFCGECANLGSEYYPAWWNKVLRSWKRSLNGQEPQWYLEQFSNGLLYEIGRQHWTDING